MELIIDTNIVISALITPDGNISRMIIKDLYDVKLFAPSFLQNESYNKLNKIQKTTNLSLPEISILFNVLFRRITFIDDELIAPKYKSAALDLVQDIDPKDYLFVELSLQTGLKIWTGDKKLCNGLQNKNFKNIITTQELKIELM